MGAPQQGGGVVGCFEFAGAIVCTSTVRSRRKVEDLNCVCGSTWGVVTTFEWYEPEVECWYCGRRWSGCDGEGLPRAERTLAMRVRAGEGVV